MSLVQSKPTRNADLRHAQSLGRQRKAAGTTTPHQQAQAVAKVVRMRIGDGQPIPNLSEFNLSDDVWSELCGILMTDELREATLAAAGAIVDAYDPAPEQTPPVAFGWRDHEPAIVHSLKWKDADGIEHLHVIRADTLDEALVHVKKLKLCIAAAKSKTSEPAQPSTADSRPDWCHTHSVVMKQRGDESQGYWHSHKGADGKWCRGKAKT